MGCGIDICSEYNLYSISKNNQPKSPFSGQKYDRKHFSISSLNFLISISSFSYLCSFSFPSTLGPPSISHYKNQPQ